MKKKYVTGFLIIATILFVGIPRIMSVDTGLPYSQFWDEPKITQGALNGLKNIFDENKYTDFLPQSSEVVYGGFIRYTCMLQDAIYYQYVRLTDPLVFSLRDIKTSVNGEQILTVSHPRFYYWNRIYHVSFSVLAFIISFLIVRKIYGTGFGIIAVMILASNVYYFNSSYIFVTNVPLGTMTIITIYFAVLFNYTKKYKFLLWSLAFSGISMATKMTGAATILIPFISGLANYDQLKKETQLKTLWKAIYLGLIPLMVFIFFTPSVYLNTGHFLHWMEWLSNLYKTGGLHSTMEPGLEHLMFQFNLLVKNHGVLFSVLAGIGIVSGVLGVQDIRGKKKELLTSNTLIVFLFPLIYILYVTLQYKISYHRNFILFYPILTVLSVMGLAFVVNSCLLISTKIKKFGPVITVAIATLIFILNLPTYKNIYAKGEQNHNARDTRTKAVKKFIAETNKPFFLGIENGLKISFDDLKEIRSHYGFFDISNLDSALLGFTHLMVPDYQFKKRGLVAFPDSVIKDINEKINLNLESTIDGRKLNFFHDLEMWTPIYNPKVRILKASEYPPPLINEYLNPIFNYSAIEIIDHIEDIVYVGFLEAGSYKLTFDIAGTSAQGEYPIVELKVNNTVIDSIASKSNKYLRAYVNFDLDKSQKIKIKVRLINDYWNPETLEDRNAYFKSFSLKKVIEKNE